jgi:hypothetical protein
MQLEPLVESRANTYRLLVELYISVHIHVVRALDSIWGQYLHTISPISTSASMFIQSEPLAVSRANTYSLLITLYISIHVYIVRALGSIQGQYLLPAHHIIY